MAVGKPRGKNGMRPVYVYDPARRCKVYVGSRKLERDAKALFREKTDEFAGGAPEKVNGLTMRAFAAEWLRDHHGPDTPRPQKATKDLNAGNLRPFLDEFGDRLVDGGLDRPEALKWARGHRHNAKTVSAMLNDAVDDGRATGNPLANRRQPQGRERKHIKAFTAQEVDRLADIALRHWGIDGYGLTARAWVLFAADVGSRPGETFSAELRKMNLADGTIEIKRIKKRGGVHPVDTVVLSRRASQAVQAIPNLPKVGQVFLTIDGKPFGKGSLRYYWEPIRSAFRETVTEERWAELLDGSDDGKTLDFYTLRHFCASQIVANGGNEYDVSHQLGNSPEVARETYIHTYTEQANERIRRFLEGADVVDLGTVRRAKEME